MSMERLGLGSSTFCSALRGQSQQPNLNAAGSLVQVFRMRLAGSLQRSLAFAVPPACRPRLGCCLRVPPSPPGPSDQAARPPGLYAARVHRPLAIS
eukprot:SM000290S10908  [mRNA]  locus=s290:75207:76104:- [translate_table: standard]